MAQPLASLLPPGETQFLDNSGTPLAGGSVTFFIPNTSTLKTTWQDSQEVTPNSNPVVLDAGGRATIYGSGAYQMQVNDASGNLVYTAQTSDLLYWFNLPATTRTALSGNQTYYISNAGNDSTGTGTSSSPWATPEYALEYIATLLDLRGYQAIVQCADGTYVGVENSIPFFGGDSSNVIITGDASTPSNVVFNVGTSGLAAFYATTDNAGFTVQNLKIVSSAHGIQADQQANIQVGPGIIYGACTGSHEVTTNGGQIFHNNAYTISGGAVSHWNSSGSGSVINAISAAITLTGTPAFSTAFAVSIMSAQVDCANAAFSGSATGSRFNVSENGVIYTGTNSLTALPGSTPGVLTIGGIYDNKSADLLVGNNLSDVANPATARTNLGVQASTSTFANVAQAWTNVTGSRAFGTTYTNSTGAPIMVSVFSMLNNNSQFTLTVNGTAGISGVDNSTGNPMGAAAVAIVPVGGTYSANVTAGSLYGSTIAWLEFR